MCGIAGIVTRSAPDEALLRRMAASIGHRGPDDEGIWADAEAGIGFAHRRLSIVDLSPAGHQPMASRDGRLVLNYNGEIYNHAALRAELEAQGRGPAADGGQWRGHSDTETLIECIAAWGLEPTLTKAAGMFAFALWDARERRLHLVRDRFGEKPLYYGWVAGAFAFASELKALRLITGFDNEVSREALSLFTRLTHVPAPLSIYEGIYKLEPGSILSAKVEELRERQAPGRFVRRWWSYRDVLLAGLADPVADPGEADERLEQALAQAVADQAIADVPVGAFLSGGVDSSTVAALFARRGKVSTFTIGFEDSAFDEAPHARAVAAHLATEHHESRITAREAQDVIPLLPAIYDEPFADSSQIPTFLICRHARSEVAVALSGDGGDEMFGGYNRYLGPAAMWSRLSRLPRPLRAGAGALLGAVPAAAWNAAADLAGRRSRQPYFGAKVQRTLRIAGRADDLDAFHDSFVDEWGGEAGPLGAPPPLTPASLEPLGRWAPDRLRMMYRDALTYLPDDILVKVDRAAMAVSLETRLPLLDHRVAEVAARLPLSMKIAGGEGKKALRRILYRHVPKALIERPKTGFAVPVGEWLRGPLRGWAEELLEPRRLRESGFDMAPVQRRWAEHLRGRGDHSASLWAVLAYQAWRESSGRA